MDKSSSHVGRQVEHHVALHLHLRTWVNQRGGLNLNHVDVGREVEHHVAPSLRGDSSDMGEKSKRRSSVTPLSYLIYNCNTTRSSRHRHGRTLSAGSNSSF